MKRLLLVLFCLGALVIPTVAAADTTPAATVTDTPAVATPDGLNDGESTPPEPLSVVPGDSTNEMWGS